VTRVAGLWNAPVGIAVPSGVFLCQDCRPDLIDYNHLSTRVNSIDCNFSRNLEMAKAQHGGSRPGAGRKQANPEGPAVVVTASVPSGLMERLNAIAEKRQWTRSQAITEAVRAFLKRR